MTILIIVSTCMALFICWVLDFNPFESIKNYNHQQAHTSVNQIRRRFKRLLKSAKHRNIQDVKDDLLETLSDYKTVKTREYIQAKNLLDKSYREIDTTLSTVTIQKRNLEVEIKNLKRQYEKDNSEITLQKGTIKTYAFEKYTSTINALTESRNLVKEKLDKLNDEIDLFSSKYELKRAEIGLLLADNLVDLNLSTIDLNLDDLVIEFKDKQNEIKNTKEITAKINNIDLQKEETDMAAYKDKFLTF